MQVAKDSESQVNMGQLDIVPNSSDIVLGH